MALASGERKTLVNGRSAILGRRSCVPALSLNHRQRLKGCYSVRVRGSTRSDLAAEELAREVIARFRPVRARERKWRA